MRRLLNIVETFNQPLRLEWRDHSTDDLRLIQAHFQIDDGHFIVEFKMPYYNPGFWTLQFTRNNSLRLSGTGRAMKVLTTVMQAAREFISTVEPRSIEFAAANDEPSRANLYPKLLAMMMRDFPNYEEEPRKAGRKFLIFRLKRPEKPFIPPEPSSKPDEVQPPPVPLTDEEWARLEELLR